MTYDEQTIQSACVKLAEMLICDDEVLNADSRAFEEHAKALANWFRIEAEHYIRVTKDTEAFAMGIESSYEGLRILDDGRVVCDGSDGLPVVICGMSPAEAELMLARRSAVLVGGAGTTARSDTPHAPLKSDELLAVERLQPAPYQKIGESMGLSGNIHVVPADPPAQTPLDELSMTDEQARAYVSAVLSQSPDGTSRATTPAPPSPNVGSERGDSGILADPPAQTPDRPQEQVEEAVIPCSHCGGTGRITLTGRMARLANALGVAQEGKA